MEKFFDNLIQKMKTEPDKAVRLMLTAEEEFKRAGYREDVPGVANILIVRLDVIGDMVLTSAESAHNAGLFAARLSDCRTVPLRQRSSDFRQKFARQRFCCEV